LIGFILNWIIYLLTLLQLLDLESSLISARNGGQEINPVLVWASKSLGEEGALFLAKTLLIGLLVISLNAAKDFSRFIKCVMSVIYGLTAIYYLFVFLTNYKIFM